MKLAQQEREVRMASLSPLMEEILQNGGCVELTVSGNSMYPMLRHRVSRVRLAPVNGPLQKGDLPLYQRKNGKFILHRIVALENGTYTCCGDNQWQLEYDVRHEQVIAVATDYARGEKWISCTKWYYRYYWRFWVWIRPLRRLVFGGLKRIGRIMRR